MGHNHITVPPLYCRHGSTIYQPKWSIHYSDVIWVSWHLKQLMIPLFVPRLGRIPQSSLLLVQYEGSAVLISGLPSQRSSNATCVSILQHHRAAKYYCSELQVLIWQIVSIFIDKLIHSHDFITVTLSHNALHTEMFWYITLPVEHIKDITLRVICLGGFLSSDH